MPKRPCSALQQLTLPSTGRLIRSLACGVVLSLLFYPDAPLFAEVRVVSSQGEFFMGDRDTREDAMRLATEAAKRNALEQVATYLESVTVVEGTEITKDEIRTYTAGLILVLDQQANLRLDGDRVVVTVDLTSQIDTEEVAQAILAFRENESARNQLATLRTEIDDLHKELEAATRSLASAFTAEEAQQASLQREDLLDRLQSNAFVSQAWTDWVMVGPVGYSVPWGWMPPYGLLNAARGLYPKNPHVEVAERIIVTNPPGGQSQLPPVTRPILPHSSRQVPRTLNETSQHTSTLPLHLGNQTNGSASQPTVSSSSQSIQSLHRFLQPPSGMTAAGQAPATRRLPPTIHQHRPSFLVPRGSYMPRRGVGGPFSGGGRAGGGARGGGGGRGR